MKYKFRGKRIDNLAWVVGSLSTEYDGECFISYWASECTDASVNLWEPVQKSYQVYPDTVGIWTRLKDKNGKEIYEGDLLKRTQQIDGNWVDRIFENYEVAYNASIAGFEYKPLDGKEYKQYTIRPFGGEELEITGNIHDVKPAVKDSGTNTMKDPNLKAEGEVNEQATNEAVNAQESAAQDAAVGATENAEEGGTEG